MSLKNVILSAFCDTKERIYYTIKEINEKILGIIELYSILNSGHVGY